MGGAAERALADGTLPGHRRNGPDHRPCGRDAASRPAHTTPAKCHLEVASAILFCLENGATEAAVILSRAKCLAIVVMSPRLLEVECRTPRQMRLANALCRFREMAEEVGEGAGADAGDPGLRHPMDVPYPPAAPPAS